jgi:membrane fusion protein (multidrug efflux system)
MLQKRYITRFEKIALSFFMLLCSAAASAQPSVVAVEAREQKIFDRVEALGTLQSNQSVVLTATVTEKISAIHFQDGQFVTAETVLVEMTSDEEQALLSEAQSRFDEAKRQYNRVLPLREGGAAPSALIDERQRDYETTRAQLAVIQARLKDRIIITPFDGVLGLRNVSLGALVTPGEPIVTLDDVSIMKLDFSVPSIFLPVVSKGLAIEARTRIYPERVFEGSIASIASRIDPVTRSVVVRALLPNPEGELFPGALMTVVLLKNRRSAILVPEESIVLEGDRKFVFVINEVDERKLLERREVVSGARQPGSVEIVKGVRAGEMLVAHGTISARDNMEVRVQGLLREDLSISEILRGAEDS